ncbi:MAG: hypothetical protein ACIAS6_12285 [Phycisphaerales bacterium JB060]
MPEHWLSERIGLTVTKLDDEQFDLAREALYEAAASIPPEYFGRNPTRVYLFASIHAYGIAAGGSVWSKESTVYVAFPHDEGRLGKLKLQRWFYSELGTVIYRRRQHLLPTEAWSSANPPGFEYAGDSVAAVKAGRASTAWSARDLREGFLGEYSKSELSKDVSHFISELLVNAPVFHDVRQRFPRIGAKAELAEAFLHRVHPGFTEAWFESIEPLP